MVTNLDVKKLANGETYKKSTSYHDRGKKGHSSNQNEKRRVRKAKEKSDQEQFLTLTEKGHAGEKRGETWEYDVP